MKVLEITPYEPPVSGWVTRVKLLRRVIESRGGTCEVLDVGPSRRVERPGCVSVHGAFDYLAKVTRFARGAFTIHCHINGEYFRGLLLCVIAATIARIFRTRCVVTFHAGAVQPFFQGWRRVALAPMFKLIFVLAHAVICNSAEVKRVLTAWADPAKLHVIPAFSVQYLDYRPAELDPALTRFLRESAPVVCTYLCFRDGFFVDTVVDAFARLVAAWPQLGLVVVGTGPEQTAFERQIADAGIGARVALAGDLGHDAFMTLLSKTAVHLRTPVTDGVSATVLEALSLGVPVVASANGTRPLGVATYHAADAGDMAEALDRALRQGAAGKPRPRVLVEDTAAAEVDLLLGRAGTTSSSGISGIGWRAAAAEGERSA